ncbi:MAG: allantoate amidohydrolase [Ktedonobacteraceae bacterium]
MTINAHTVMQRCDVLGTYSEEPHRLTRPFASPAMHKVNQTVARWMRDAGMSVLQDSIGNLIGRYEAYSPGLHHSPNAAPSSFPECSLKTLLLGSHLDTVRDAGKYDGPLGVMIALACVERLNARKERLPFAIEVLGFADEEGLRYHSAYIGSKAMTGTFDLEALHLTDADGISMEQAIQDFGGNPDPTMLHTARWRRDELLAYCEVHIEQGPILEARNLPVGIVSAIASQKRITVQFVGEAGHAGTVPMSLRRDALCAAAEFVLAVETLAHALPGLVATVGQANVQPGASNVIPGQVTLSLDVRHQDNAVCEEACQQLEEQARQFSVARNVSVHWQLLQEHLAVPCSLQVTKLLAQAIEETGYSPLSIVSGAGHDAAIVSHLTAMGMLFVRCRGGISHNPAEAVTAEDIEIAIAVLERFLALLAQEGTTSHESL